MTDIFEQKAPQLNSKNGKKNGLSFCKTFAFIRAGAGIKYDDFVNSPISALRFITLPLRRTKRTPRGTRFARLDLDLFTKSSIQMAFHEFIKYAD
jgi:hypothetical protein